MRDQKIREWAQRKLDEGIDPQRLRKVLEKKGYEPSIVDEISDEVQDNSEGGAEENESEPIDINSFDSSPKPDNLSEKNHNQASKNGEKLEATKKTEHLEKIAGDLTTDIEKGVMKSWKPVLGIAVVLVLIGSAWMFLPSALENSGEHTDNFNQKQASQSTDENTKTETEKVVFEDGRASPSDLTIPTDQKVVFSNSLDQNLEIDFERNLETLRLETGESQTVEVGSTVYYTAFPTEADGSEIYGSINVN